MANEMHYMWVFVVLSLVIGVTLGMVMGMRSPTGAAVSGSENTVLGRKTLEPTSTAQNTMAIQYSQQAKEQMITQIENILTNSNNPLSVAVKEMIVSYLKDMYLTTANELASQVKAGVLTVGEYNLILTNIADQVVDKLVADGILLPGQATELTNSFGTTAENALAGVVASTSTD